MATENRIRIDFTGTSGVKVTKTSIVEAVKLLTQDAGVTISESSHDLVNKVTAGLWTTRTGNQVTLGLVWNDPEDQMKVKEAKTEFKVEYNKIDNIDVSMALPKIISSLIREAKMVKSEEINDDFV